MDSGILMRLHRYDGGMMKLMRSVERGTSGRFVERDRSCTQVLCGRFLLREDRGLHYRAAAAPRECGLDTAIVPDGGLTQHASRASASTSCRSTYGRSHGLCSPVVEQCPHRGPVPATFRRFLAFLNARPTIASSAVHVDSCVPSSQSDTGCAIVKVASHRWCQWRM